MVSIIDCLKKEKFKWSKSVARAFEKIKEKLTTALVLRLLIFSKVFEVACDASGIGIDGVLRQESSKAFFSEKLNEAKQRYENYNSEFYAIMQSLGY